MELCIYPFNSNNDERLLFRRWLAVTANGPAWCVPRIPATPINGSFPFVGVPQILPLPLQLAPLLASGIGVTTPHTEADRRSAAARPVGVRLTDCISTHISWPASVGSEPAASPHDCEPELSRRKRPITDLTCLGLDSPPKLVFVWCLLWFVVSSG